MSAMVARRNGAPALAVAQERRRCAIYTRKSTSHGLEKDFNSLDAQREACEAYVSSHAREGWELVTESYDDGGFTGANMERPGFRKLLADIDAGEIDIVVVYKVDRLSRSLLDFAKVMDRFDRAGVAFVSVTQKFSTADAMGRLTLNMLISFAEFEREMIAERTRDKIAASRRRGKWTGGPIPLGYDAEDGCLVVNDLEAAVVGEVFELYLEHRSALAVMRELNARKRRTKLIRTKAGNMRGAKPWTKDAVLRVLKNPLYAGYVPYGDELHEGEHDAILDRDTWTKARALLASRPHQRKPVGRNPDYLLRGLLRCECCGSAFTTASTRKGRREYRYYRCVKRDKEGTSACPAQPLPAEAIEGFVLDRIREVAADATLVADLERRLKDRVETERATLESDRRSLPGHIARLSAEGRSLVGQMAEMDGAARRLIDERVQEIGADLGRQEARLAEVEQQLGVLAAAEVDADWVGATLRDFDPLWDAMTPDNRARLVRALVRRVVVNEPIGNVTIALVDLDDPAADDGDEANDGDEPDDGDEVADLTNEEIAP